MRAFPQLYQVYINMEDTMFMEDDFLNEIPNQKNNPIPLELTNDIGKYVINIPNQGSLPNIFLVPSFLGVFNVVSKLPKYFYKEKILEYFVRENTHNFVFG